MVIAFILFIIGGLCICLSVRMFKKKGGIFTIDYILSNQNERKAKRTKYNYYSTASIFLLIGCSFIILGLSALIKINFLNYLASGFLIISAVLAITFSIKSC